MGQLPKRLFCDECRAEVEVVETRQGPKGSIVPKCSLCGSMIKVKGPPSDDNVSFDEMSFNDDSISVPAMDKIMVVGYTPSVRQALVDKMVERNLAGNVYSVQNGEEMIVSVIDHVTENGAGNAVDLIVTDVPMPFLNGINASIGLRAIERTYPDHDLIPILFLTNKPCDDTFKKVIRFLAPAKYATLGPVDDKPKWNQHVTKILSLVAKEKW